MFRKLTLLLTVIAATCVVAATAYATSANRTFVSNTGLSGNTASGCSAGSPCDTFANALSVTNAGGEINCLNAGDFGTVTISQSVTINCEGVSNGGITASSGSAITINTASITVNLIGLELNGLNGAGGFGVDITAPAIVNMRNCKIYGFSPDGIGFVPSASGGTLVVDNVLITNNTNGIYQFSGSGSSNMSVRNSTISNNSSEGIFVLAGGGRHAGATIEQTTLAFNGAGLQVTNSGAIAVLGGSTIVNNTTGVSTAGGGTIYSFKNNQIGGNGSDGTPLTAYPGGPLN